MSDTGEDSKPLLEQIQDTEGEKRKSRWRYVFGIFSAFVNTSSHLAGVAFIQLMVQIPPDFELSVFRFGAGFLFSVLGLLIMGTTPKVQTGNVKWICAIAGVVVAYNLAMYSCYLKNIPLVTMLCIHQSFKLIMSLIFTRIILKHNIPLVKCVVCLVTLLGAILTVIPRVEVYVDVGNPDISTSTNIDATASNNTHESGSSHNSTILYNNVTIHGSEATYNNDIKEFLVTVAVISCASLASVVQTIIIAGSPLKDESVNVLTFWYFFFGLTLLLPATFILEQPFIPDNTSDILLCFGHSIAVYSSDFFFIVANQILEVNTVIVVTTVRLPLAFLAEETFLKDVVPVKRVYLLVIGTIITSLTTVAMPVYELWFSRD